ncbi:unnamed protein product [Mytilus edulis]|uniref:Uncharacterized protein n=1 Tax=Mytilus edulis TaxID=6550 RepID=A0A8S3TGL5_MYTED|nr:unnamed protein product [Mytilus edulis]
MFLHILLLSSFNLTYEFLLTNTTGISSGGSGGASLTDSHYLLLMDLIGVQKQSLAKMESFVLGLQGKVNSLEADNSVLKRQNNLLNQQIADIRNVTFALKGELNIFKHSSTGSDILNFTTLQSDVNVMNSQMMAINSEIARLSSNSNARGQDFIALLHEINAVSGKLKSLNQTTTSFQNIATGDLIDVHTSINELNQTGK